MDFAPDAPSEREAERPSKTQAKKAAHELQALGEQLAALKPERYAQLPLSEGLREALDMLRNTRSHEGRRRQLQYVGKLMRNQDAEPLREALAAIQLGRAEDSLRLHTLERWREALLADDSALTRYVAEHPQADVQALRHLVRQARRELARPEGERNPRPARELFQRLKALDHA